MLRHWLAGPEDRLRTRWIERFDPSLWTVDFPRPMLAAVTSIGADALAVDVEFLTRADLAGLIWESVDRWSHPLRAYETRRDYRGTVLSFHWQAEGALVPLDAGDGPTLTIEGRDGDGVARTWYVRLWNYAAGSGADARIRLDFDDLRAGFAPGGERVPVADIDRLFISLLPPGHDGTPTPLPVVARGRLLLSEIVCDGSGSMLRAGDAFVPPHGLHLAGGYDDSYNQTPERLLEQAFALGYRGSLVHYVGMSHVPGLALRDGAWLAGGTADPIAGPARAWHRDFLARAGELGFSPILSLSFELLDQHCPDAWAQRDVTGGRGLTGYTPPSALLSPAHGEAMAWLQAVARQLVALAVAAGVPPRFQIGEPWWWVGPDHRPCLYDAATVARYRAETGTEPPVITDIRAVATAAERAWLDWCGGLLGAATLALRDAVRAEAAGCEVLLLFYAPQVLNAAAPELLRANLPAAWAWPAFDALQLEDYDFVTGGDAGGQARARAAVSDRLHYPLAQQHYFSGFAAGPADWPTIADAAVAAIARGVPQVFVWAWPQLARDGATFFAISGDAAMPAFHDVLFPLELGYGATGGPEFSTQVVITGSGHEQRNSQWADARLSFDAGVGVRSEADLAALIGFFRARRGQAHGFRFRDPLDHLSGAAESRPTATDQPLGLGDGRATRFALIKTYGTGEDAQRRRITRPVGDSVIVAIDGVPQLAGWRLGEGGHLDFDVAPGAGATVTAGFVFDVPVRFAVDRIDVGLAGWRAGDLPSVPLVEIRED